MLGTDGSIVARDVECRVTGVEDRLQTDRGVPVGGVPVGAVASGQIVRSSVVWKWLDRDPLLPGVKFHQVLPDNHVKVAKKIVSQQADIEFGTRHCHQHIRGDRTVHFD